MAQFCKMKGGTVPGLRIIDGDGLFYLYQEMNSSGIPAATNRGRPVDQHESISDRIGMVSDSWRKSALLITSNRAYHVSSSFLYRLQGRSG